MGYIQARDLDTMPWRATSPLRAAIVRAADEGDATLCDVEQAFRNAAPDGVPGWELMIDHVHLSLRGQALLARTLAGTIRDMNLLPPLPAAAVRQLPDWQHYAERLGDNPYDRYSVDVTMQRLFSIPFFRRTNPAGLERFSRRVRDFERTLPPALRNVCRAWQDGRTHKGGRRPLSGMAARELMRMGRFEEAHRLFKPAMASVPPYSAWYLEYAALRLARSEKIHGELDEPEREQAAEAIRRGELLLRAGRLTSGATARYVGRLHQLRGEFGEAIPYLLEARRALRGADRLATDQALIVSYLKSGRPAAALETARAGAARGGEFAPVYRRMLNQWKSPAHPNPAAGAP